ncbi:MAG: NAD(P)/FAD-dependent oxidoreductase [Solirubrobacteraceae bacterium]
MSEIAVIGGGVAGLCCAYYLRRTGANVTVVESNRVGSGASYANGGWLCPAQAGPLPEPGLGVHGLRSLAGRDSTLYFSPRVWPRLAPWLLRFWTYCNAQDHAAGTQAIARLGRDVFDLVEEIRADGAGFELSKQGMLYAARTAEEARAALHKLAPMRRLGYTLPDDVITGDDLYELEPALSPTVTAGFLVKQHWYVKPDAFTRELAAMLRRDGVRVLEGSEVLELVPRDRRITTLRTAAGDLQADTVVLAAGSWTMSLARSIGIGLPMQAGKGYSFSVRPGVMPRHAILLADLHVGCTPFDGFLRIGGTMEFSGVNNRLDHRRINAIVAGARKSFRSWASADVTSQWAGMRPITADGLPVIDRAGQYDNVYLATGYGMQGVTLAPSAGKALAELITTGHRPPVLEPFRLDRFARSPLRRIARRCFT